MPGIPLTITSSPWGAEARIDGKSVGQTPKTVELPAGSYKITLLHDGAIAYRRVQLDGPDEFCWDFSANAVCR